MKGTKGQRERKNSTSREQWMEHKAAAIARQGAAGSLHFKTGSRARSLRENESGCANKPASTE